MNSNIKYLRYAVILIALLSVLQTAVLPSAASSGIASLPTSHAEAFCIYNIENDIILAEKETDKRILPASSVKIMSGLICCEALSSRLDEKITVKEDWVKDCQGRMAGLKAGMTPTVKDLLYMGFCGCFNDAIMVLEVLVSGNDTAFVAGMNTRAADIGMTGTFYVNATGIHNSASYTTVADLLLLAKLARLSQLYMEVTSAVSYTTEGLAVEFDFYNNNKLHISGGYRNSLCRGMNAGSTPEAGYCCVTSAEKNGLSYICIVMGADIDEYNNIYSFILANRLISWAIDSFAYIDIVSETDLICELPVEMSIDIKSVLVVPERTVTMYLPADTVIGEDITWTYKLSYESLEAPVTGHTQVGFLSVYKGDELLDTVSLVTKTSVSKSELLSWMQKIKLFSQSRGFIAALICGGVLTVIYIIGSSVKKRADSGSRRRRRF